MFGKPIGSLLPDDIDRLCKEAVRESDVVEFKREMSANKGRHRWYEGVDEVGDAARDAIANEIMAFANAHGGTLVLGIAETQDKPARAETIVPVPRCAELARRLAQMLGDIIEPPLAPFPTIVPVMLQGDAGVVVMQVAASRNAPHRHRQTRHSYVRRGEEAVPMTMREIQDLTLQVDRGLALLNRQFEDSANRFRERCRPSIGLGMRATVVPLAPLSLPIPNDAKISPRLRKFKGRSGRQEVIAQIPGQDCFGFMPVLRGIRSATGTDVRELRAEVRDTGFVELFYLQRESDPQRIAASWFIALACNALTMADYLREAAGGPGTEFGLEMQVHAPLPARALGYDGQGVDQASFSSATFPRYQVGDRTSFQQLAALIDRDFWNATGMIGTSELSIDFE